MCFNTNIFQRARIAKSPILVYKVLDVRGEKLTSFNYHYEYKPTIVQPVVELEKEQNRPYSFRRIINKGYHSYHPDYLGTIRDIYRYGIKLHANIIKEFIIPEGAKFYYNKKKHEFVSNLIIMI